MTSEIMILCCVASKVVSGKWAASIQLQWRPGHQTTTAYFGGTKACVSFPENVVDGGDDADGDLPAGACGCECEPAAFVCHVSIRVVQSVRPLEVLLLLGLFLLLLS